MDTDELSNELYKAVFIEAENFHHDLTSQFGLIADSVENEKEYIEEARILIREIKSMKKYELEDIFFEDIPKQNELKECLDKILKNIEEVEKIPEVKRHYDF